MVPISIQRVYSLCRMGISPLYDIQYMYVSLLRVPSVQQPFATLQQVARFLLVSFVSCLISEFLSFYWFRIFRSSYLLDWRVRALVPGTLALDLPTRTLIHLRFLVFLCLTAVWTQNLYYLEWTTRTDTAILQLSVLLLMLGRKNG